MKHKSLLSYIYIYTHIIIKCNMKIINYLHFTLNVIDESYRPYKKPNENRLHTSKFRPQSIHFKTTSNSNSKTIIIFIIVERNFWRNCAILWTVPLKLRIQRIANLEPPGLITKSKRQRNILWFNPP